VRVIVGADQPFGLCIKVIDGAVCLRTEHIGAARNWRWMEVRAPQAGGQPRRDWLCGTRLQRRHRGEATGGEVERLGS